VQSPASLLILKPSSLGDVVHTLPAVAALRRQWPHTLFRWMVNPEWAPLLEGNPCIDEILLFPRGQFRGPLGPLRALAWTRTLKTFRSELVLDFQGLLRSALVSRLCRARRVAGLSDAREGARFFYDHVVDVSSHAHAVDRYLALARAVGASTDTPPDWPLPNGDPVPDIPQDFILLHPFSRGTGKSLSAHEVENLCHALAPLRILIAGRSSKTLRLPSHATNLLNQTSLPQLIWLLRRAAFVFSVDSGPMHIAAALGTPLLSLHTWSDPRKVGPYNPNAWIWQNQRLFLQGNPEGSQPANAQDIAQFIRSKASPRPRTVGP